MKNPHSNVVKIISRDSPFLNSVKALWRKHADTLGFFPDGAFEEYAAKKQIVVAVDFSGGFLGYLLFRITPSRNDASIVHLCVDPNKQRQGVAALLVKELIQQTKILRGISLRCRRDFQASKLWPRLGFVPVSDKAGKSSSGSTLTYWWLGHNHPDLLSLAQEKELEQKLKVIIDANVFFDLKKKSNEESMALIADWLEDSIAICITDEMLNEINRSSNSQERIDSRSFASQFPTLPFNQDAFDNISALLGKYLPTSPTDQDKSDFSHLAKAIAAHAEFFVTRDDAVLNNSDNLYSEFGISVLRPADLIIEIDSLTRGHEYQPARLAGTLYKISKVQSKQESLLVNTFQNQSDGEKQSNLKDQLRRLLSLPHDTECLVAWTHEKKPIGLIACGRVGDDILDVSLLRAISNHTLSASIIRFLISLIVKKALFKRLQIIQVSDLHLDEKTKEALVEDHFVLTNTIWSKLSLPFHSEKSVALTRLGQLGQNHPHLERRCKDFQDIFSNPVACKDPSTIWKIEDALWPVKITDSNIPCFIVPIQPKWALHLFDEHLANRDFFGAKIDLGLNREGVYYRAKANSSGLSAPARILWYVSQDNRHPESGCIRAYSRLDEVLLGTPKLLYRQFRRLGIYDWKDVFAKAKNNLDNQIMALRFCKTEMLDNPYPWNKVTQLLAEAGIKTQLQSPCRIPANIFFSIASSSTH